MPTVVRTDSIPPGVKRSVVAAVTIKFEKVPVRAVETNPVKNPDTKPSAKFPIAPTTPLKVGPMKGIAFSMLVANPRKAPARDSRPETIARRVPWTAAMIGPMAALIAAAAAPITPAIAVATLTTAVKINTKKGTRKKKNEPRIF